MRIARSLLDAIVEHAVRDAPHECCGVVLGRDRTATSVRKLENLAASSFRFDIDGRELLPLVFADEDSEQLLAIYHSHTRSEPYPSQTDVNFAAGWPGVEWLIVGISKAAEPVSRSYLIDGGVIKDVELEIA
ncbi:MAG: Mov34/MPN/PAD-1 family protein [Solirubrobacteraceae bacterium]